MVSQTVRMTARKPANLFQQITMAAVSAAMPATIRPTGFRFITKFSTLRMATKPEVTSVPIFVATL